MKDILTSVILSIKPIYAKKIMDGTKTVEFRKKVFKKPIDKVFVYSSAPQKKIIGYFTVKEIIEDSPQNLWDEFRDMGGIDKDSFFDYYRDYSTGFSIKISKVKKFKKEIDPCEYFDNFNAPQSYIYLEKESLINVKENC